jgi:TolB-like protein
MKRKIVGISIFCLVLGSLFYVNHTKKDSWSDFVPNSLTEDSVIQNLANENIQIQEFEKTGFTWKDSKGDEYPVYIAHTGSCFVIKTSKSGEDYRAYLGEEVSEQIRKELNNRKSNDVVAQDTISSFLGKPIVINDKIYEQISAIAAQDKMLSYSDSIIQIGDVRWCVNLMSNNIVLMTSVQPDASKMKQVVKYLTGIYGKPYEEDGYDIKWSSPDNTSDTFRPHSTFVHLRRVHSEEGGTFLFFK